jgi:hypothetical protein
MSHPSVQHFFRDAQYSTLSEARSQVDKGFTLRQRVSSELYKLEAPWRVDLPPPSAPTPSTAPAPRPRPNKNDAFANAAYHQIMSSTSSEPFAAPTTQRMPPPPTQSTDRPVRDYRRLDRLPIAPNEDSAPVEESSSASPAPNPTLPANHWRNEDKGERDRPPQYASRHPPKFARNDYAPSARNYSAKSPAIPLPPDFTAAKDITAKATIPPRPELTPGEAGVPPYM